MAKRKSRRRSGVPWTVTVLLAAVAVFCVLTSWEDKNGGDVGLPALAIETPGLLQDILDGFGAADGDNRPVSATPDDDVDEPEGPTGAMPSGGEAPDSPIKGAKLEVHFLDLGQAESILIKAPSANLLIDAGENNQGADVIRYLHDQGVRKLDYVVGTHPHSDHIGGLDTVVEEMNVKSIILPNIPDEIVPTTQTYTDLLLAIARKGLQITPAKPGKTYDLGDGAELRILGPIGEYGDLNNTSVVCRLSYGDTAFVFTGDTCSGAESDIVDSGAVIRADVLNVAHHGSNTSSSEAFLNRVAPRIAVLCCGLDNSYGHPHREVMEALEARNIRILRTDRNGAIVIASDGERLAVSTEK